MIELILIFATAALVCSLIAIQRYNSYHKGLNELIQRMDNACLNQAKLDQSILSLEQHGQTLAKNLENGLQTINNFKEDFEKVQRTTNDLALKSLPNRVR